MSNKLFFIYFLVLLFGKISYSLQPGPVPLSARSTDLIQSQSCDRSGWSCKDCSTLQSCGPDNIFKFQISCGDQFPDRPYCDPRIGRCVSDRHVCSEMKDPEFKCPDIGIYPDLTDCRRYISCRAKGEVGLIYSCLFESVYNPIAKRCITNSYCYNTLDDCNGEYKTMAYNPDPSLYIVCRGDEKPLIKDCGSKMLEYDPSLLACDFKCKEEGRFAHATNKSLFYICVYNNDEIVRMMGLCRENTIYDEIYDTCVHDFESDTTTQLIVTTESVTELATVTEEEILGTTTENIFETTVSLNDQNSETTAVNEEPISEAITENINMTTSGTTLNEELILETTTENINGDETTINKQDFETTIEDVTINSQKTSTVLAIEKNTTTENTGEAIATTNGLEESETFFTTDNTQVDLTTSINLENETNSSNESLETTEKNDTNEETDISKNDTNEETDISKNDTNEETNISENDTNEETDISKNETNEETNISENDTNEKTNISKNDSNENETEENTEETKEENTSDEQNEETREKQSNEDEDSNQSSKKSKEKYGSNIDSEETNEATEKSENLKDKKRKCIGRICMPNWKIPGFLKKNKSN